MPLSLTSEHCVDVISYSLMLYFLKKLTLNTNFFSSFLLRLFPENINVFFDLPSPCEIPPH